jgi:hypothetical protein
MIFSWTMIDEFYDGCAELCRHVYVLKTAKKTYTNEQSGGINTHQAIDNHLRKHDLLPPGLQWLKPYIDAFRAHGELKSEVQWAIDYYVKPCTFWGTTNGKDPYVRGKWDLAVKNGPLGFLVDWKDGKRYEKDGQLELGALLWMFNDETIQQVTAVNFWLQDKAKPMTPEPYVFRREQVSALWGQKWLPRLREIEAKDARGEWEKRPVDWRCRNCPVVSCGHNPRYGQ